MKQQFVLKEEQIKDLHSQNDDHQQQIQIMQSQSKRKYLQNYRMEKRIKSLEEKKEEMQRLNDISTIEIVNLKNKFDQVSSDNKQLQEENKNLMEESSLVASFVSIYSETIKKLETSHLQLESLVKSYEQTLSLQNNSIVSLEQQAKERDLRLATMDQYSKDYEKILINVRELVQYIPSYSEIRYPIIRMVSQGFTLDQAGDILQISRSQVYRARQRGIETLLVYYRNESISRISNVPVHLIIEFWLEICTNPSGSIRTLICWRTKTRVSSME